MNDFYPTRTNATGLSFGQWYPAHHCFHPGIDFNYGYGDQDKGQPVRCPWWGVVEYVSPRGSNGGLGLYVVVYHPSDGLWTRYLHLDSTTAVIGQKLAPKEVFATLGDSGTTSSHLHFELLTFDGLQFVKHWVRPYGRYATGLSKKLMLTYWQDPTPWLNSLESRAQKEAGNLQLRLDTARKAIVRAKGVRKVRLQRLIERLLAALGLAA